MEAELIVKSIDVHSKGDRRAFEGASKHQKMRAFAKTAQNELLQSLLSFTPKTLVRLLGDKRDWSKGKSGIRRDCVELCKNINGLSGIP